MKKNRKGNSNNTWLEDEIQMNNQKIRVPNQQPKVKLFITQKFRKNQNTQVILLKAGMQLGPEWRLALQRAVVRNPWLHIETTQGDLFFKFYYVFSREGNCINLFQIYFLFYLFLAVLGLHCCSWTLSSFDKWRLFFSAVYKLLIAVASLVAQHKLQAHASVAVMHWLSCFASCGIFLDQGLNPCPLH